MTAIRRILSVMLLCAVLATAWVPARAEGRTAYVASGGGTVYDPSGAALATLPENTALTVTGVKGNLCRISYKGKTGYMKKSELAKQTSAEAEDAATEVNAAAYVSKDGAKVYNAKGEAVGKLALNTQVTVTAVKGDVCQISCKGKTGYMNKSDLSKSRVAEAQPETKTAYVSKDGAKVYNAKGKAVGTLELNTQVTVTAVSGSLCKISLNGKTGYMSADDLSSKKTPSAEAQEYSSATPAHGTAKEMDWWTSDIQKIFARGVTATITDVETGLAWREQRRGGTNHADVQPLTAADTAALKQAYGGTWSWTRRAIFVTINGVNYAASMNGMPHGSGAIKDNNFNGHHCIHFTNSRTHGSNRVCQLHQAAIQKALESTL